MRTSVMQLGTSCAGGVVERTPVYGIHTPCATPTVYLGLVQIIRGYLRTP